MSAATNETSAFCRPSRKCASLAQPKMDRKAILASLKAITYASGRAFVALSKGDTAAYLNDLASFEQSLAAIHAKHGVDQEIVRYHTEEDE